MNPCVPLGTVPAFAPTVSDARGRVGEIERSLLIDDAAMALGVSRRTVYYRIREGRLRTIRTRCGSQRVLLSSIEELRRGPSAGGEGRKGGEGEEGQEGTKGRVGGDCRDGTEGRELSEATEAEAAGARVPTAGGEATFK